MREFSIPELLTTCTPEEITSGEYENIKRWITMLRRHGYISKIGPDAFRREGQYQKYGLAINQVDRPLFCGRCGQSLSARICIPQKKEIKTKTETKKEKETV